VSDHRTTIDRLQQRIETLEDQNAELLRALQRVGAPSSRACTDQATRQA
jgi:hypothetical protein